MFKNGLDGKDKSSLYKGPFVSEISAHKVKTSKTIY